MESATAKQRETPDPRPHMGSEYTDAQTYLTQRAASLGASRKRHKSGPQHGSNDSDFGIPDQKQD